MNATKQDITRLKTISGYAKLVGKTRATIYAWIDNGKLKTVEIDGVTYIKS